VASTAGVAALAAVVSGVAAAVLGAGLLVGYAATFVKAFALKLVKEGAAKMDASWRVEIAPHS
jgi:hypothetical protein